jgi:hypothetical protein
MVSQQGGGWDLASTVVGQQMPSTPPRASAERRAHPSRPEAATPQPQPGGSNTVLLAVIGFVAVLLIGGLVILLLYLNSQG